MTCPFCSAAVVPGARFCHTCGGPLSPEATAPATERRVVTVLIADLSDFTAWSESQDPERVGAVTDRLLAVCAQAVTEHGGHVDKLTGDGIMAVFGAPLSHDDDVERAVRAAAGMQRGVRGLLQAESGGGVPMGLRVGLRTGLVVAGMQASLEYTVIGDTVNTAARLSDIAAVGTVYASGETMKATRHVAAWRQLSPVRLKGKSEPVEVYELLGLHDEPGTRASLGDQAPFVGRDAELGRISGRLAAVVDRDEPLVVVHTAEAGIGKTRFGRESERLATQRGARVLAVRTAAYGEGRRYGPLADLVRRAAGLTNGHDRREAERRLRKITERHASDKHGESCALSVDVLLALLGYGRAPGAGREERPGNPSGEKNDADAIPAAAAELFNLLARSTPLVLIVDDLHAATTAALDALGAAVARLTGPILVLLFGRPELVRSAGVLTRISEAEAYTLAPLRGTDAARLLSVFCDNGKVDTDDEALLLGAAQGNPYYLAELVTLLTEQGVLAPRDGRWRLVGGSLTGTLLSSDLAKVLASRIDSLPVAARGLLRAAAVVGDVIPALAMDLLASEIPGEFDAALQELLDRRMLRRRTHGGFRFMTPLLRQAAYDGLGKADAAHRHAHLARWAHEADLDGDQADELVVVHAEQAVQLARAMDLPDSDAVYDVVGLCVDTLYRAAQQAMDAAEPERAISLMDRSERLRPLRGEDRIVRARALLRMSRIADTLADLDRLAGELDIRLPSAEPDTDAKVTTPSPLVAQTLLLAGRTYRADGEAVRARSAWRAALDVATEVEMPSARADALCRLGMLDYLTGRIGNAEKLFTQASDVAKAADDGRSTAWALQHLAWVATSKGDFAGADDVLHRAARCFASQHDLVGRAWVRGSAAFARLLAGRLTEARKLAETFLPFGERVGDTWAVGTLRSVDAFAAAELGDLTSADTAARSSFRDFTRIADDWGRGFSLVVRSVVARHLGELPHAMELVAEAEEYAVATGHPLLIGMARTLRGHCLLESGEPAEAQQVARAVLEVAVPHEVLEPAKVGPLSLLADTRAALGDRAGALRLLARIARRWDSPALLYPRRWAVARYAELLLADGRPGAAVRWAERATACPGEDVFSAEYVKRVLAQTRGVGARV